MNRITEAVKSAMTNVKTSWSNMVAKIKIFYSTKTWQKVGVTVAIVVALFVATGYGVWSMNQPNAGSPTITDTNKTNTKDDKKDDKKSDEKDDKKSDEAKTETPKTEAPKTEAPKTEAPKTEAPKTEAPKPSNSGSSNTPAPTPKPEAPAHSHDWTPIYTHHVAQPAQGYNKDIPAVTKETVYVYFGNGHKVTEAQVDAGFDIDEYSAVNDTNWWTGVEVVVVSPGRTEWVETAPAQAAWDEVTGHKCSCGATK